MLFFAKGVGMNRLLLLAGCVISILMAWGMRFFNEDLYVALCAGRDTVNGLLGKPDQWSFNTGGQVWVDQSWLSHLVYYLSYRASGELGPVLLKGILLILCVCILYGHCRSRGCAREAALSALLLGVLSLAPFLQIRAENFGVVWFVCFMVILQSSTTYGRLRNWGALAVMVLWSGSHGSAVLGFGLLALRCLGDLLTLLVNRSCDTGSHDGPAQVVGSGLLKASCAPQAAGNREVYQGDPLGWFVTLVLAAGLMACANPYGPANLFMPFRQVSASSITAQSTDWLPLLDLSVLQHWGFLQPLDVMTFLLVVCLAAVLLTVAGVGAIGERGLRGALSDFLNRDRLLTVLIPVVLFLMAVQFRRIVLFASLAMVPLLAWLLDRTISAMQKRFTGGQEIAPGSRSWIPFSGTLCVVLLLGLAFARTTVVPYMHANPMRPDRPVISQLMSFDPYGFEIVRFMNDNGIRGRILATWSLSNYLLFYVPGIKVFMDCRDQSAYSDEVIKRYFFILNSTPQDAAKALEILDQTKVEFVILAANPRDFRAATLLMATRRWGCIYKDDEVIVLARSDSERFGPIIRSAALDRLTYSRPQTRVVSTAILRQFMEGAIPAELLASLRQIVLTDPEPNLYSLITFAMNGQNQCLNAAWTDYLVSQAEHLSAKDFMVANGAKTVLESLVRVYTILDTNQKVCRPRGASDRYEKMKKKWEAELARVREKYLGYRSR